MFKLNNLSRENHSLVELLAAIEHMRLVMRDHIGVV